nr:hypothetical protein [Candidatus Woesearchaeota archaeon]
MKQKVKLIFIVLVAAMFLIGCTQKQEAKDKEPSMEEIQGGQVAPEELDDELDGALQDLDDIEEP